jgi:prepilin-type processing-associated H-X9-DG protein
MEVLVTISILGVLAALTVPVFQRVKSQARLTYCSNSLRQIHSGALLYAADNDGWLPPAYQGPSDHRAYWFDVIAGYLNLAQGDRINPRQWNTKSGTIFHCPDENTNTGVSYSYNRNINRGMVSKNDRVWKLSALPGNGVFIIEARQKPELVDFSPSYGGLANDNGTFRFGQRHGKKANVLFFGGHVEVIDTTDDTDIKRLRWTWPGWEG